MHLHVSLKIYSILIRVDRYTLRPWLTGRHFIDDIYKFIFKWNILYFVSNSKEDCSWGFNWQWLIGSSTLLSPSGCQAIARTNMLINSLAPGRPRCHFKTAIFNLVLLIGILTSSKDNALRWMSRDITDDKSTLVQVMSWCRQATSHYLSQCWPSSMSPYDVTRPRWAKISNAINIVSPDHNELTLKVDVLLLWVWQVDSHWVTWGIHLSEGIQRLICS